MPRFRTLFAGLIAAALAAAAGGCSGGFDTDNTPKLKLGEVFATPDWAKPSDTKSKKFSDDAPVPPEDFVGADGRCAAEAQASAPAENASSAPAPQQQPAEPQQQPAAPQPQQASAPPADRLEIGPAGPANPQPGTPLLGGIALGMTECQAVRRAGVPSSVQINADDKAGRVVTLTYLEGTWPGIYRFESGRLREIDRAPAPPTPPKPEKKKPAKKNSKPKTAAKPASRDFIQ